MTEDQEAQIGAAMRELALSEGHRPNKPISITHRVTNSKLQYQTVYEMLDAGGKPADIARTLGVTRAAVYYHKRLKDAGL